MDIKEGSGPLYKYWLAVIVILFLVVSSAYNLTIPYGRGPDESAHMEYVRILAEEHRLPMIDDTYEAHQPPLYYAAAAGIHAIVPPSATGNLRLHLVRGVSTLLGAGTILLTAAAAATVLPTAPGIALLVAAMTAFHPLFGYESGVVNNDAMAIFIFALFLYQAILLLYRDGKAGSRRVLLLGLITGLALLAKSSLIVLPLPFLLLLWRRRPTCTASSLLTSLVLYVAAVLAVSGWWFLLNFFRYGELLPHSISKPMLQGIIPALFIIPGMVARLVFLIWHKTWLSFFAPLWIIKHFIPMLLYFSATITFSALSLGGLCWRRRELRTMRPALRFCLLALGAGLMAVTYFAMMIDFNVHEGGRFLLGFLPAFSLPVGMGLGRIASGRRWPLPAAAMTIILLLGDFLVLRITGIYALINLGP